MNNAFLFAVILLCTYTSYSQTVTGKWRGDIYGSDGSVQGYNEVSLSQNGDVISGQISGYLSDGSYVKYTISGEIHENRIKFKGEKIISYKLNTGGYWCLIDVNAKVLVHQNGVNSIEGTASHLVFPINGNSGPPCPSVRFKINRLINNSIAISTQTSSISECTISGQVFDKQTRRPVKATLSIIGDKSPMQTIPTRDDGKYSYNAPISDVSDISITTDGYEQLRESLNIDKSTLTKNFFLTPKRTSPPVQIDSAPLPPSIVINGQALKKGESIALNSIQFEQSKSDLLPEGKAELNNIVQLMKQYPTLVIELSGHTSNEDRDEKKNLKLSEERITVCKNYISNQVANVNNRVKTVGYGSSKPRVSNNSDENRRKNRRVELKVESL